MKPSLTILLPVYNPTTHWAKNVLEKFEKIKDKISSQFDIYLVIVNDGSSKNIEQHQIGLLKKNISNFQFLQYKTNQGKGFALRFAINEIQTDYIVYTDIDFPYELNSMLRVIETLQNNDVVIGVKSNAYYKHLPMQRKFISLFLQKMIRLIFPKLLTSDTQCGLKAMNQKGKEVFLKTTINRYLFDLEFVFLLKQNSLKASVSELTLREGITFSKMNNHILFQELGNFLKIIFK